MLGIRLSRLPVSAKIFCTLYLLGIGCGAIAAMAQAATAVGLTPADVQASFAREMPMTSLGPSGHGQHQSAEKEISIGDISSGRLFILKPYVLRDIPVWGKAAIRRRCIRAASISSMGCARIWWPISR